jgi:hypothetical protein
MAHVEMLYYMYKMKTNHFSMEFTILQHPQQKDSCMTLNNFQVAKDQLLL